MVGSTNTISGGAQGAATGFALGGPYGAIIGGGLGAIGGAGIDSAERDAFRANRAAERRKNQALVQQASRTGEAGARLASTQRAALGAAGVGGASAAGVQFDTIVQTYRDQLALMAGITDDFQGRAPLTLGKKLQREYKRAYDDIEDEAKRVGKRLEKWARDAWDEVESWF